MSPKSARSVLRLSSPPGPALGFTRQDSIGSRLELKGYRSVLWGMLLCWVSHLDTKMRAPDPAHASHGKTAYPFYQLSFAALLLSLGTSGLFTWRWFGPGLGSRLFRLRTGLGSCLFYLRAWGRWRFLNLGPRLLSRFFHLRRWAGFRAHGAGSRLFWPLHRRGRAGFRFRHWGRFDFWRSGFWHALRFGFRDALGFRHGNWPRICRGVWNAAWAAGVRTTIWTHVGRFRPDLGEI